MESSVCGEFTAVTYKIGEENSCVRNLFIKKHEGNDDTKPSDRTLFVLNVPQFLNKKSLKFMYEHCGSIKSIHIHSKPKCVENENSIDIFSSTERNIGYKVAYIVFENPSGLLSALKCFELPPVRPKKFNKAAGLCKWIREYNSVFLDTKQTTQEIEAFMVDFDKKLEEEKQKAKDMEADEEGWVTVTKENKKAKVTKGKRLNKRIIEKQRKAEEKKTLLNFYRCQLRDAKMEHILELRKRFDKDKERIALMKTNRKFKPF